jgi:hypothetical protein
MELLAESTADKPERRSTALRFVTSSAPTAGDVLVAALAKHGIRPQRDTLAYAISAAPADPVKGGDDWYLYVADRRPGVDHAPDEHTGWDVWLCDGLGEPVEQLYAGDRRDSLADCASDSAAAAATIATYLTRSHDRI